MTRLPMTTNARRGSYMYKPYPNPHNPASSNNPDIIRILYLFSIVNILVSKKDHTRNTDFRFVCNTTIPQSFNLLNNLFLK